MVKELHFTKDDFKVAWFSGTGAGGQHRNRSQNCCRITHIETGITAVGQQSRSARQNKKSAFRVLAARLIAHYDEQEENGRSPVSKERVRTYNRPRNQVIDHASGFKKSYTEVMDKGGLDDMINARREAMIDKETI